MKANGNSRHDCLLAIFASLALWASAGFAANSIDADTILDRMHAAFPRGPLAMDARLQTKTPSGKIEETYELDMVYARTNGAFSATLTLRDAFGTFLDKISLRGIGTTNPLCKYYRGAELQAAEMPDMSDNIRTTDFSWHDLTLEFLWWPNAQLVGRDSLKNHECYVLEVPAPRLKGRVYGVRLWIHTEMYAPLRALFFNADGEKVKRFDVKSFAKTGDLWMVKDVDIRSYPSRHRTSLRVRDVQEIESLKPDT